MQDIQAWLTGSRNFGHGAELYLKYGKSSFFKELLAAGPTPYNKKKLGEELEALAPSIPAIDPVVPDKPSVPIQQPAAVSPTHRSNTQMASDHSKYIQLCAKRDEIVRRMDRNMAALDLVNNQAVLHETAKQILRLYQQKQEVWAQIDFYNQNQTFEEVAEVPEKSREEKMQLIYQSLSKARKRLANPDYKDKARTQKLIDKKLKELEVLKGGEE